GFSRRLEAIQDDDLWDDKDYDFAKISTMVLETSKMEYLKIPFDVRLTLFTPEIFYNLQTTYEALEGFVKGFLLLMKDYQEGVLKNPKEALKKLGPDLLKEEID